MSIRRDLPRPEPVPTTGPGLLLLHADPDPVEAWATRGLVAVDVVPMTGWTAVLPKGPRSAVHPPYHEAVPVLLARPVPFRLRPAIGLCQAGDRALVAVISHQLRARRRWLAWEPGCGLIPPGGLPQARIEHLALAADLTEPADLAAVQAVLERTDGGPLTLLSDLMAALDVPGAHLLSVSADEGWLQPDAREVRPKGRQLRAFDKRVGEDRSWRDEIQGSG